MSRSLYGPTSSLVTDVPGNEGSGGHRRSAQLRGRGYQVATRHPPLPSLSPYLKPLPLPTGVWQWSSSRPSHCSTPTRLATLSQSSSMPYSDRMTCDKEISLFICAVSIAPDLCPLSSALRRFLMEVPDDGTQKYGFEYGGAYTYLTLDFPHLAIPGSPNTLLGLPVLWSTGMIQEFLQQIVENRRESDYLVENVRQSTQSNGGASRSILFATALIHPRYMLTVNLDIQGGVG